MYWHIFANSGLYLWHLCLRSVLRCRELLLTLCATAASPSLQTKEMARLSVLSPAVFWSFIAVLSGLMFRHLYTQTLWYRSQPPCATSESDTPTTSEPTTPHV